MRKVAKAPRCSGCTLSIFSSNKVQKSFLNNSLSQYADNELFKNDNISERTSKNHLSAVLFS